MVLSKLVYHIFSVYAPQVGRSAEEKEELRERMEDVIFYISDRECIIVAGDCNCRIGTDYTGNENVVGL